MVHWSMENGSRVADELYIKRVSMVLEDFLFFSLYSFSCIASNKYDFERYSDSCSLDTHFEFSSATSISPAPDPARYTYALTGNYTLCITQATGHVAYVPPLLCGDVYASSERHVCYTLRRGCSYAEAVFQESIRP